MSGNSINWGYSISRPRALDMDGNDMMVSRRLLADMTDLQSCIACGACAATCTAGAFTDFNLRRVHTLVRRGEYKGAYEQLNKCMLCGKCRLVCPRGINTRKAVMKIKTLLGEY